MSGVWLRAHELLNGGAGAAGKTSRAIAQALDVDAGEVGRVMRLMEKRGHIERAPDCLPTRWKLAPLEALKIGPRRRNTQE